MFDWVMILNRPTADIREILVLHMLQDEVRREMTEAQRNLRENGVHIFNTDYTDKDVQVLYKNQGVEQNAVFMKAMLDAEVRAKLRVMRVGRWKSQK